jgi:uncharacterized protein (DUF983 family)
MADYSAPDTVEAALRGLCPRCGAPGLFDGIVRFSQNCSTCRLDFTQFNVGDGPAAFLIMIVGGIVTCLAIWLQLAVAPPFWVHMIIWLPVTSALVIGLLRIAKGALLVLEFRNRASEGRLAE